jgi:hypothetical protein
MMEDMRDKKPVQKIIGFTYLLSDGGGVREVPLSKEAIRIKLEWYASLGWEVVNLEEALEQV